MYMIVYYVPYEGATLFPAETLDKACLEITRLGGDLDDFDILKLADDQPDIYEVMAAYREKKAE